LLFGLRTTALLLAPLTTGPADLTTAVAIAAAAATFGSIGTARARAAAGTFAKAGTTIMTGAVTGTAEARRAVGTRRRRHHLADAVHELLEFFFAELLVLVLVEVIEQPHRVGEAARLRTTGAIGTAGAGTVGAGAAAFGTTAAARRTTFAPRTFAHSLTAEIAGLLALLVAELAVLVFVEPLEHLLAHPFAVRLAAAIGAFATIFTRRRSWPGGFLSGRDSRHQGGERDGCSQL
jgi:hypothetical protein